MPERDLLTHVYRANTNLPPWVTLPPGDDAAGIHLDSNDALVMVDQLADGVHVDLASTPLEKVARKAVTRNLSDVAAMAGLPVAAVVAAALPRHFGDQRAKSLFDAMAAVALPYGCPLIGGDLAIWDHPLLLSVTVLAQPAGVTPITRQGTQPGDRVCVTGYLGGSRYTLDGYTHHLDFEPRIGLARRLATHPGLSLHAMIDLSDGLAVDLAHLCQAGTGSPLAARLWTDRLPISPAAQAAAQRDRTPAWQHAVGDGEDYELCFTLPGPQADSVLPREIDGVPITPIGTVTAADHGPTVTLQMQDGRVQPIDQLGWEHRGG